jgi:hypothetical protein
MYIIPYKNNQMQKWKKEKVVEITWNPKKQEKDECKYLSRN